MKTTIFATLALTLLAGTAAQAADNGRRDQSDRSNAYDRDDHRDDHGRHAWNRGQKIGREDMRDADIYRDWRDSGLRSPPRGTQWMIINGQYLLVDRRSGYISEVRIMAPHIEHRDGDRDQLWRQRYSRAYTYSDDIAYTECRSRPDPAGVLAGAFLGAVIGNAAAGRGDRGGATAAGVIAGGALGAALTSKMDCGDRSYAYQTYSLGFNGGHDNASYQWTNPQNHHRGEMRVLNYYNDEDDFRCANFTQTVYIGNRPEEAHGRACQQPDGNWAIID